MKKLLFTLVLVGNLLALSAEEHTYVMSDYGKPAFTTADGLFTTLGKQADGVSGPSYNGSANSLDVRLYAKNTYKITSNSGVKMERITFCISKNGHYKLAELTPSTGTMDAEPERLTDDNNWKAWRYSWTGNATEVTFTVGEYCTFGSECAEQGKTEEAGTLMFKTLIITDETASALNSARSNTFAAFAANGIVYIEGATEGATAEILNLTGTRLITAPIENGQIHAPLASGIYIVKCGHNIRKIAVK